MCFNAPVSIASFLIGTIGCIFLGMSTSLVHIKAIACVWQYSLVMQLLDAVSWSSECQTSLHSMSTTASYWFNITQPLALLAVGWFLPVPLVYKLVATLFATAYFVYVYSYFKKYECVKTDTCSHLDYAWWSDIPYGGIVYTLSLVILTLLLFPTRFALAQLSYVLITLFVSSSVYGCGAPSVWCFFQVLAPLFTYLTIRL